MLARGLIDTGAIVALLNSDDQWHRTCVDAFESLHLPLATSAAVLAELVQEGWMDLDEALSLVPQLMNGNAHHIFNLKEKTKTLAKAPWL